MMFTIIKDVAYRTYETKHKCQEYGSECCHDGKCRGEHGVGLFTFFVGKAEESGFHAKSEENKNQCRIGIDIHAHAIVARCFGHAVGVERHKQIIKESAHYGRQSIDGCVFSQSFKICHCVVCFNIFNKCYLMRGLCAEALRLSAQATQLFQVGITVKS